MKKMFVVACAAATVGLVGCGNQNQENQVLAATEETTKKLAEQYVSPLPDDAPVVKVATEGTMVPFTYQDEHGNLTGLDIEVIRSVGDEAGFKVEFYQDPSWSNLLPSVASGQRDLVMSTVSYTDERAARYGLSDSYLVSPPAIMYINLDIIPTQDGVASLSSLRDKRVGVMAGTTQDTHMRAAGGYSELVEKQTIFLLFESLIQNQVDAILQDEAMLRYFVVTYPQHNLKVVPYGDPNSKEAQLVAMVAKENTELLAKVNEGLAKIKANGKLKAIEEKYLGGE